MSSIGSINQGEGMTLRQAALVAGFAYLLNPVTIAEAFLYPKVVIPGNIEQTAYNAVAQKGVFAAAILCYLISLIGDIVIAWALYVLFVAVNRSLSRLTAWFQLMYTAIGLFGLLNLVTVYRLFNTPDYRKVFGAGQLQAQAELLLNSFRYDWSMSMVLFGIHLVLLGLLIHRSHYIPSIIGVLLVIDGSGWVIDSLRPYVFPNAHLEFLSITFAGELFFMLWLLIRGWKIQEPLAPL